MDLITRTEPIVLGTTAAVTLPEKALLVTRVARVAEGATSFVGSSVDVVSTAATSASEIQFQGTSASPSDTLTLNTAPATAGGMLWVTYVPEGALPRNK